MWTRLVAFLSRLGFLPARQRLDDEAAEELDTHLELLTARYVKTGMPTDEAAREARRQLGNPTLVREDIYRMNGIGWLDALASDFRYAVRMLRRQPAFSAVAIATLALGIGANTAIVSVVYSVLLHPLPYQHPDRLYSAEIVVPERRQQFPSIPASIQTFIRWRETPTDFADIAALRPWECNLTGDGEPERAGGARVSSNFFSLLGVPMARGRALSRSTKSNPAGKASSSSAMGCGVGATPPTPGSSAGRSSSTGPGTSLSASRRRRCSCRPAGCSIRWCHLRRAWTSSSRSRRRLASSRTRAGITASSCDWLMEAAPSRADSSWRRRYAAWCASRRPR